MLKACQRACALAAFGVFAVAGSVSANAVTLDIIDYIDDQDGGGPDTGVGEQAIFSNPIVIQGVTLSATGALLSAPNNPVTQAYAYLDGGGAGMGVCSGGLKSGDQCKTGSDDNVGVGQNGGSVSEELSISFADTWSLDGLLFRDEGHNPDFYNDSNSDGSDKFISVRIAGIDLGAGVGNYFDFLLEDISSGLGAGLVNWTPLDVAANTLISLKNANQQFYLSGIELSVPSGSMTPVPLPAGLILLLSGLLGLGAVGKFRKQRA